MEYLAGAAIAGFISAAASWVGFDRDRAFYPTLLIVIASYCALFSVLGSTPQVLAIEVVPIGVCVVLAVLGFKRSAWFVVAGLLAHAVFDVLHPHVIHNDGVPGWWPGFCLAYDTTAAAYLAAKLLRQQSAHIASAN